MNAGIYRFYFTVKNIEYSYVGQTNDFSRRFDEHAEGLEKAYIKYSTGKIDEKVILMQLENEDGFGLSNYDKAIIFSKLYNIDPSSVKFEVLEYSDYDLDELELQYIDMHYSEYSGFNDYGFRYREAGVKANPQDFFHHVLMTRSKGREIMPWIKCDNKIPYESDIWVSKQSIAKLLTPFINNPSSMKDVEFIINKEEVELDPIEIKKELDRTKRDNDKLRKEIDLLREESYRLKTESQKYLNFYNENIDYINKKSISNKDKEYDVLLKDYNNALKLIEKLRGKSKNRRR